MSQFTTDSAATQSSPTNPSLTSLRRALALTALSVGAFGLGISEFATMGVLGSIAEDLVPNYFNAPEAGIAQAGAMVSAYALGVFIGAPLISVLFARRPQHSLAPWLLLTLALANLLTAVIGGLLPSVAVRFLAGLPHGAYLGLAALLAGYLLGPGMQARGVAFALSGLTVANVVGVPLATWVGQSVSWRWIFVAIAVLFVLAAAVLKTVLPTVPGDPGTSIRSELKAFTRPRFWLVIAVGMIGFGGFFAIYTYLAEAAMTVAGLEASLTPFLLAAIGLGMVFGNIIGGAGADRNMRRTAIFGLVALVASLLAYLLVAMHPAGIFITAFLVGLTAWTFTPAVQSWLIDAAEEQRLLGSAMNHAAFNAANSIGAWSGGAVIALGYGMLAPAWVGIALAGGGLVLIFVTMALERRMKVAS
ncbi:MFS transporter [Gulosibacter chungangensis]|uniref:MFS transporter n=1 Tax=Gulosibacter chungangensis TaxID=979746 RepID=A0A7J5BFT2_9MICO|nr:MFS transporter [Gulosibacter chungangensis]KAB1645084.1 MFS transporter [Gulosibacter chungangensis]